MLPIALHAPLPLCHWALLGLGLVAACVTDIRARRVPNWLTVALLVLGVASRALGGGALAAALGLAGTVTALALLWIPFARGAVGGGDVKLLAAAGAWLGPLLVLYAALVGAVVGGLLALLYFRLAPADVRRDISANLLGAVLARRAPEVAKRAARLHPPYAPAIAVGVAVVAALFASHLVLP